MANQNEAEIHFKSDNDFYQQRNYIEACKAFQKAIEIDPNYVDAYNNWGLALAILQSIRRNPAKSHYYKLKTPDF